MTGTRKPYSPPRLIVYGHVKDIVQGATGRRNDSGTTKQTGPCWVAEALYGAEDPRTVVLRSWLQDVRATRRTGWPLVEVYVAFGRSAAALVRRSPWTRRACGWVFDRLATRALDERARILRDERHRRAA